MPILPKAAHGITICKAASDNINEFLQASGLTIYLQTFSVTLKNVKIFIKVKGKKASGRI
jgi:hypothetical protein